MVFLGELRTTARLATGKKKRVKEKLGNKLLLLLHYLVSERGICFMPPLHIRPTVLTKNVIKYKVTESDAQISVVQLKKNHLTSKNLMLPNKEQGSFEKNNKNNAEAVGNQLLTTLVLVSVALLLKPFYNKNIPVSSLIFLSSC